MKDLYRNKLKGRIGLAMAIKYFTFNGYTVSIPINDTQWYDLIVEKDNILHTVQCKCTTTKSKTISMITIGGRNKDNSEKDNILNHPCDYIFATDTIKAWLIPVDDIRKSQIKKSFNLYDRQTHQGLNTFKYLVDV